MAKIVSCYDAMITSVCGSGHHNSITSKIAPLRFKFSSLNNWPLRINIVLPRGASLIDKPTWKKERSFAIIIIIVKHRSFWTINYVPHPSPPPHLFPIKSGSKYNTYHQEIVEKWTTDTKGTLEVFEGVSADHQVHRLQKVVGAVLEEPLVNLLVVERQNQVGNLVVGVPVAIHGVVGALSRLYL